MIDGGYNWISKSTFGVEEYELAPEEQIDAVAANFCTAEEYGV